jgi:hypothetical protein
MKRSLFYLSTVVLLSAMSFASISPSWFGDGNKKKKRAVPESGVLPMLVLSIGTLAGGLALKHRRTGATI